MAVKIGLISDVHATPAPLKEALELLQREEVDTILCAGDIAGYGPDLEQTVELLIDNGCETIKGNHDVWRLSRSDEETEGLVEHYLRALPTKVELSAAGKFIYMVHASPPESLMDGIKLLDVNGALLAEEQAAWADYLISFPYDVLVVGHTHQVFAEWVGGTLIINSGSTLFNHSCAILSLPDMQVQTFSLGGESLLPVWNWGMQYIVDIETE